MKKTVCLDITTLEAPPSGVEAVVRQSLVDQFAKKGCVEIEASLKSSTRSGNTVTVTTLLTAMCPCQ